MAKKTQQTPAANHPAGANEIGLKTLKASKYNSKPVAEPAVKERIQSYGAEGLVVNNKAYYEGGGRVNYGRKDEVTILGGALNKPEGQMTPLEKMNIVRTGVSKTELERLKDKTGLDYDTLAQALSVTRATLINKKNGEKFNAPLSERIVGLADIYSYGYEVFEDIQHFNQWMFRPNQALGGQAPYQLIDNQFGREEIRNIIGRIDYGVYS